MAEVLKERLSIRECEAVHAIDEADSPGADRVTVGAGIRVPELKVLYLGPFVLDSVTQKKREAWKLRLDEEYSVDTTIAVADPPFQISDLDCKGYWLKPEGNTQEKRVKALRKHVNSALVSLLNDVEKHRPRLVLGEGQGGVVVAMAALPLILEAACRSRAVTTHQMRTFREAWAGVASILIVDPVILPTSNTEQLHH